MKMPIIFLEYGCFPINITVYSNQSFRKGKASKLFIKKAEWGFELHPNFSLNTYTSLQQPYIYIGKNVEQIS